MRRVPRSGWHLGPQSQTRSLMQKNALRRRRVGDIPKRVFPPPRHVVFQMFSPYGESTSSYSPGRKELTKPQNTKTNVPGAEFHHFQDCRGQNVIQPTLFAFWKHPSADLKGFVRQNLQVDDEEWKDLPSYIAWLIRRRTDTFNFLYLYWWLFVYHGRAEGVAN